MHRTEGANFAAGNLFSDGPPGTTVEEDWLNAVQEELAYVIEQAGLTLKTAATESRTQLNSALRALFIQGTRGALVYRTASQLLSDAVNTALIWSVASYDTDTCWAVANPTRLTVPSGVTRVQLFGNVQFNQNATNFRFIGFYKGGAAGYGFSGLQVQAANGVGTYPTVLSVVSSPLTVAAGEYFELYAQQNSTGNLGVAATTGTWFAMRILQ
ncbi:MAG: hypothetical protein C4575_09360 [Desulforudis sp.]|jgi:hypothetical protein|nr:MAG: hypothetical protein C4575_09360 [Desulforudis sp.]